MFSSLVLRARGTAGQHLSLPPQPCLTCGHITYISWGTSWLHTALPWQALTTPLSLQELGYLTCVSTCAQVYLGCHSHLNCASGCVVTGHAVAEETAWGGKAKPNKEISMSQLPDKVTAACNQGYTRRAVVYLLLSEACSSGRCNDVGIIHLYFPASRCIYLWIHLACATPSLLLCLYKLAWS